MSKEWINWPGGDAAPVARTTRISLRQRNGQEFDTDVPLSWLGWKHSVVVPAYDIVAYRVLSGLAEREQGAAEALRAMAGFIRKSADHLAANSPNTAYTQGAVYASRSRADILEEIAVGIEKGRTVEELISATKNWEPSKNDSERDSGRPLL